MGLRTAWHSPRAHDEREGSLRLVMRGEPANLTSDKAADSRRVIPSNTLPTGQRRCHPLYYAKMAELHVGTGIYDAARSETVVSYGRGQTSGVPAARAGGAAGKCRQGGGALAPRECIVGGKGGSKKPKSPACAWACFKSTPYSLGPNRRNGEAQPRRPKNEISIALSKCVFHFPLSFLSYK